MKEYKIKTGDLVCISPDVKVPGALTAVKFMARLTEYCQGKTGIVTADHGTHVMVVFSNCKRKLIHKKFLSVVEEIQ